MIPFPLHLDAIFVKFGVYLIFLGIGFLFGFVLETSGFNHSPTLAAQFYFKDLRVFKVFFTAIVVAMLLIFASSAIGLLDFNLIWVNPTYLWSGIVGGLIMGVGFILGGFCPGTSLVALATLKIDGIFFVLGGLFGVFLFGETVDSFTHFFNTSGYFGRVTLMDVFNLPTGMIVILVTLMAIFMLWGGEQLERIFGGKDPKKAPKARYTGAAVFVILAVTIAFIGQPTTVDRWERQAPEKQAALEAGEFQIHPGELLDTIHDSKLNLVMLDVRSEADYNLFHLLDAENITIAEIPNNIDKFIAQPANTLFVLMSNDEAAATEAWKIMVAESVPNVYILEGGINNWLDTFTTEFESEYCASGKEGADDELRYDFSAALGSGCPAAYPNHELVHDMEFEKKIKMELKRAPSGGGCG
ncbi:MAG: YeeE/YedE family protein [Anaerolineales bacterium]|nr:YeeE/YedE family protein [Chloroflexota bacterium]MBL6982755.1 YeeE/YedE family protein [Anaerolineales bacterium]